MTLDLLFLFDELGQFLTSRRSESCFHLQILLSGRLTSYNFLVSGLCLLMVIYLMAVYSYGPFNVKLWCSPWSCWSICQAHICGRTWRTGELIIELHTKGLASYLFSTVWLIKLCKSQDPGLGLMCVGGFWRRSPRSKFDICKGASSTDGFGQVKSSGWATRIWCCSWWWCWS